MFAESLRVKHIELSGQYELAKHSGGRLEEIANLAGQVQALEWAIEEYEKTCEDEEQEEEFGLEELINDGVGITPFMRGARSLENNKSLTMWEVPPIGGGEVSKSKIEWTEETWNPMSGCTKVSEGCKNCYAETMANRLKMMGANGYENGFAVTLHHDRLDEPLKRKKPTMYFVCSMGDLFHEDVPLEFIGSIFFVMGVATQHTYQILTKRPERMKKVIDYLTYKGVSIRQNVWLGVTAENQEQADKRIPILIDTPAAVRFVSIEPMLGEINLQKLHRKMVNGAPAYPCNEPYLFDIDWVIVGGETGAGARRLKYEWVKSIQAQCKSSETPLFFKKWGKNKIEKDGFIDGVEYRQMPKTGI